MSCSDCRRYGIWSISLLAGLLVCALPASAGELLPLTDFYDTPESFATTGQPGDLIRSESYDRYKLSPGVKATRILYGSTSSQGELVASSGVVLVPPGEAPEGGWPVIAWAHGTSGVDRKCAPSLMVEVFSDYGAPNMYTEMGYAVVAADYTGLGSDYPLDYLDRISNGRDVINSVKAARAAVSELGEKWLATGHSAGAHAVRGVAELEAGIDDPSYLGVVAVSGVGNARTPVTFLSAMSPNLAIFIMTSASARFPEFEPAELLSPQGRDFMEHAKMTCGGPGIGRPAGPRMSGPEVLLDNWSQNTFIDAYLKLDETGQEIYQGPVLVIKGENEPPPVVANDLEAARRMCQQKVEVQFEEIPGANHFTVLRDSIQQQMDWMADRFAGKAAPSNCAAILP